jgi:hypothetical protein
MSAAAAFHLMPCDGRQSGHLCIPALTVCSTGPLPRSARAAAFAMLHNPGLLALQGGKEAARSNEILHRLIVEAIEDVAPEVGSYSSGSRHILELRVLQCIAAANCLDIEHFMLSPA